MATKLTRQNEIDGLSALANPNPDRVGCPSQNSLMALAGRERSIDDPGHTHLTKCSPCDLEVRVLQEADTRQHRWILRWVM
jgi:hypothetical protein